MARQLTFFKSEREQVLDTHFESIGFVDHATIKKCPNDEGFYFVYHYDGQIEYRDTYSCGSITNKPILFCSHKRYNDSRKWIVNT